MKKQKPLQLYEVIPTQQFIVVGASGAMGQLIIKKALSLGHKILFGIVGPKDETGLIHIDQEEIKLQKINEFDWGQVSSFCDTDSKPIILDATHESVVKENWKRYYEPLGLPVIFITTGITKADIGETKSHVLIASPNACPELVSLLFEFKNIPESEYAFSEKIGMIRYGITESHQGPDPSRNIWGKKNPSSTATFVDECLKKAGYERLYFESIRDREKQISMGVPEEHLDGHAWHTYRFMFEDKDQFELFFRFFSLFRMELGEDFEQEVRGGFFSAKNKDGSLVFELKFDEEEKNLWFSHFVNGRQPYVNGLFSAQHVFGIFIALISQRKPKVYNMFDFV